MAGAALDPHVADAVIVAHGDGVGRASLCAAFVGRRQRVRGLGLEGIATSFEPIDGRVDAVDAAETMELRQGLVPRV